MSIDWETSVPEIIVRLLLSLLFALKPCRPLKRMVAIPVFESISNDQSAPRDVRAKALLRLAGCYEKLGRQSRQVYERIVSDYADEPAATQARKRLAALNRQDHPAAPSAQASQ
jgi:hypothetical protein